MGIDLVKSQNIAQYVTLLSNPDFLNAVKSASNGNKSDKSDSLLKNLDKLKNILASSNSDSDVTETESGESLSLLKAISSLEAPPAISSTSSDADSIAAIKSSEQDIRDIIAKADLLESMLDLDVIPPNDELIELFQKFRAIIVKLDQETRKLQKDVKDKEVKSEYKLTPSSDTKSGFQEGLTLVAK